MFIESFKVDSPNVTYTDTEIHSVYDYQTTELVHENRNGAYQWTVKPKSVKYEFKTETRVPKLGVMLVGWGGNNGSTLTGGVIANREGISWATKDKVQQANYFGSLTQASTIRVGSYNGEEIHAPFKSLLPMVNPDDVVFGGWDISNMNLADAMARARVFDIDLQKQLRPYMEHIVPLPGIYDPDFIAANQGARANNVIKGSKKEQVQQIIKDMREFKEKNKVDKVVVLWTANTERYSNVVVGLNDTMENLMASLDKNESEISPSTLYAIACVLERRMERNGVKLDAYSYNTLVKGLCKAKKVEEAWALLVEMKKLNCYPNAVTYATLMDGLCKEGRAEEALEIMVDMRENGLDADVFVYGALMNGFIQVGKFDRGSELFYEMLEKGISPNVVTFGCLVHGLSKMGKWEEAIDVLDAMAERGNFPDVFVYTSLIDGLFKEGEVKKAVEIFDLMVKKGQQPSSVTYNVVIYGMCKEGLIRDAFEVFETMRMKGEKPDVHTYNSLLMGLCSKGRVNEALHLFNLMVKDKDYAKPDVMTFNMLMHGLCKERRVAEAENIYKKMITRGSFGNIVTLNTLLGGYLRKGNIKQAMEVWKRIIELGLMPNSSTYSIMINAFCKTGMVSMAKGLFNKMRACKPGPTLSDCNTLLGLLCKEDQLEQARALFKEIIENGEPDLVTFNTMINGTFKARDFQAAKDLLKEMLNLGLAPDIFTFSMLINRLSKAGLLDEVKDIYDRMISVGYAPDCIVYDSLLKGFSSNGDAKGVISLLHQMSDQDIVLDRKIMATIVSCLCQNSRNLDVSDLPNFSESKSSVGMTCKELLSKLGKSHPDLQISTV